MFLLKSCKYLNVYYLMFVMIKCYCGNIYKINKLVLSKCEILYCQYDMISCLVQIFVMINYVVIMICVLKFFELFIIL